MCKLHKASVNQEGARRDRMISASLMFRRTGSGTRRKMEKKNVIYIHTHDSGRILSPYGYKVPTPNLEHFSRESAVFRNAYCVSPTCSPSRASMLTGTYPHQNGMLGLAQRGFTLDSQKHLAGWLGGRGYRTVLCGIQHEAGWYLDVGNAAGALGYQEVLTAQPGNRRQEDMGEWDRENALKVCRWLENYDGKAPFFLSYGMYSTHRRFPDRIDKDICPDYAVPPYPVPDSQATRKDFAGYLMSVRGADRCFGLVADSLKAQGLWENTIVIFTTDHGIANPFAKCTLFDSGTGVALMLRVPKSKSEGRVIDSLVSHLDVFPTLCGLLGEEEPDWLEGKSLVPLLEGTGQEVREAVFGEMNFHTSYEPARSVRTRRYKYIRYYDETYLSINQSNMDESITKDYFMNRGLKNQRKQAEALYDLVYDPGERRNVAEEGEYVHILKEMRDRLACFQERTQDPLLLGEIPIKNHWKVNKKECIKASSADPADYVSTGRREACRQTPEEEMK